MKKTTNKNSRHSEYDSLGKKISWFVKTRTILDGAQVANCCISTHKVKLLFLTVPHSQELLEPKQE